MRRLNKRQRSRLIRILIALSVTIAAVIIAATTPIPWWGALIVYLVGYVIVGYDVALRAGKGVFRGQMLDENFLMFLATVGAFIIGEYLEGVAVMLFYQVGELFQSYAVASSRASITSLMEICPDTAVVERDGKELTVFPGEVAVGEIIVVRPGERIPLDGVVTDGISNVNTAALTGESMPIAVESGAQVLSGSINESGVLRIRTSKPYEESTVARIMELMESAADKKARTERFITRFAAVYTPIVVGLAVVLAVLPPLIIDYASLAVWSDWVYRALNFLVVSCPCALVISVPLAFFGAMGGASKKGILVKGGGALEAMAGVKTVAMDKTGTITKGAFEVKEVVPSNRAHEILTAAAIAEGMSNHPIARSITQAAGKADTAGYQITEAAGKGAVAVGKDTIVAGSASLLAEYGFKAQEISGTVVHVARGEYLGAIVIGDTVKPDSAAAVSDLRDQGVRTVMLTGDQAAVAAEVAAVVGVDEYKAGLLPGDKVSEVEKLLLGGTTAFVGDGINDAPVLMRADVGIAMGGIGSDSAIEAADVVLMQDSLKSLPILKKISKKTMRISRQNIALALGIKGAVLIVSALGFAPMWLAIFADVGVAVLAILNSMRMLKS